MSSICLTLPAAFTRRRVLPARRPRSRTSSNNPSAVLSMSNSAEIELDLVARGGKRRFGRVEKRVPAAAVEPADQADYRTCRTTIHADVQRPS